ncbi:hypothetical protein SCP_0904360 [Sparassis crispa]|uniref:Fork-head domain-containing protein n=1 Tax=Sparassis crispa TaxID=139825 RepID=A0A401GWF7_9APHY|nr:hypothetical protein SCP_0904360 [Sparassis crispa]GBE86557.1 hypothetical protein SCP_0904360 [Sparassis crispa]
MDTMEMVMERMSRKRSRASSNAPSRDARRVPAPVSSAPSRSATPQPIPATPHHYRYYSERVVGEASLTPLSPVTPRQGRRTLRDPSQLVPRDHLDFRVPEQHINYPKTPAGRHIYSSSARRTPSLSSSPARIVNLVSSPGPMRPIPLAQDDKDDLPYVLPPGPYQTEKPDFSYAAMIGQAILSSPQHRLTLQDIYEWIATVYSHYKRGEQTWMNSVRHALSTMAVFRKVPRVRTEGKSLWAIWDDDLECFANGGFRKAFCVDMQNDRSKQSSKKRAMEDAVPKKTKKRKKLEDVDVSTTGPPPPMLPASVLAPFFPSFHPNPHHQPYYQTYTSQPLPAEVIFPPLPASSNYHQVIARSNASRSESIESIAVGRNVQEETEEPEPPRRGRDPSPKFISSSSPVPDLTPNCSSSSSPLPSSITSLSRESQSPARRKQVGLTNHGEEPEDTDSDWLGVCPSVDSLEPGFTLLSHYLGPSKKPGRDKRPQAFSLPLRQVSPTPTRRVKSGKQAKHGRVAITPPPAGPSVGPSTPPRKRVASGSGIQLSPIRTPISHMGLHMSPSPSLAHYKLHLDPPPIAVYHPQAPLLSVSSDRELSPSVAVHSGNVHTPSRKRSSATDFLLPVTPKRLVFSTPTSESPFRTPSRSILDPHDPSTLLDEELCRLGSQVSPGYSTLFGRSSGLLYESPGSGRSPASWGNFW